MKKLLAVFLIFITCSVVSYTQNLSFKIDSVSAIQGDSVVVPINVTGFSNIGSFTLVINYNNSIISWGRGLNWHPQIDPNDALINAHNGVIALAFANVNGQSLTNGVLVELKFLYNGSSSLLEFATNCEVTDIQGVPLPVNPAYIDGVVVPRISVEATASSNAICLLDDATINAVVTGGFPTPTYSWTSDPAGFTSTDASPVVSPIVTTTYTVVVTDGYDAETANVTVELLPDITPTAVSNMFPADNTIDVDIPMSMTWMPGTHATMYDIFIWEPVNSLGLPVVANTPLINLSYGGILQHGTTYNWKVHAKNSCASTPGPTQSFTTRHLPDLIVASIQTPITIYAGQDLAVSWSINNVGLGGTLANQWSDGIYLSLDTILTPGVDILLGSIGNLSALNIGETYVNSNNFTIPSSLFGNYYIIVKADVANVLSESDETNNYLFDQSNATLDIILPPKPDLVCTSIGVPTTIFSGLNMNVNYEVENTGFAQTISDHTNTYWAQSGLQNCPFYEQYWYDAIYISPNPVFSLSNSVLLKTAYYSPRSDAIGEPVGCSSPWYNTPDYLEINDSYTMLEQITIPHYYYGIYYIYVITDKNNYVSELADNNNIIRSNAVNVVVTPPANLVVNSISAPANASSGDQITISWEGFNAGATAPLETSWKDKIYLSTLDTFNLAYCSLLGTQYIFDGNNFDQLDSYNKSMTVTLPQAISGQYYIYVYTDQENDVFEYDFEDDNDLRSQTPINIVQTPYPDLTITNIAMDPITAAGQTVNISWTVTNNGIGPATGFWSDRVYISATSTWAANYSTTLLTTTNPQILGIGESYTMYQTITIPANVSGSQYIYVYTDYSNSLYEFTFENNNVVNAGIFSNPNPNDPNDPPDPTVIPEVNAFPDLVPSQLSAPLTAYSGTTIPLSWMVQNIGNHETNASYWYDRVYLSTDAGWSVNDVLLTTKVHHGILNDGDNYTTTKNVTIPNGISGNYHLLLFADALNMENTEWLENNNLQIIPITIIFTDPPDLIFSNFTAPATAISGQTISIEYTVKNDGTGNTPGYAWYDKLLLSTTPDGTGWSYQLMTSAHTGAMAVNDTYTKTLSVNLPSGYSGYFFLVGQTDYTDQVYEHNDEGNNETFQLINITQPLPSDLVITNISAPASVVLGEDVSITYTVTNQGQNDALGIVRDAFYFSEDASFDGAVDKLHGVKNSTIAVAPGSSYTETITERTPAVLPGDYTGIGRTNILNSIYESDNTNNITNAPNLINVSIESLILDVPTVTPLDQGDYKYYKIEVSANLDLLLTVESTVNSGSNEVYVAFDRVPELFDFDYIFENPNDVNQQVLIPSTQAGNYYVMVRTQTNYFGNQTVSILAQALPFSILSVNPDVVGDGVVTTEVSGAGFKPITQFFIYDNGVEMGSGSILNYTNSMKVDVKWDFEGVPEGTYDVVAINPLETVTLPQGIEIETSTGYLVDYNYIAPNLLRVGANGSFTFYFMNVGNVDIPYIKADVTIPNYSNLLALNTSDGVIKRSDFVDYPGVEILDYHDLENSRIIPVIYKNLQPGDLFSITIMVSGFSSGTFPVRTRALGYDTESFIFAQLSLAENLRLSMFTQPDLFNVDQYPEIMALLSDCEAWRDSIIQYLADAEIINVSDTANMDITCSTLTESISGSLVPINYEGDFTFNPGTSPGTLILPFTSFESGDDYLWEINLADGEAGINPGWDLIQTSGSITVNSSELNPFVIRIASLNYWDQPDYLARWYPAGDICWPIAIAEGGFVNFDPTKFSLDLSRFTDHNPLYGGTFSLELPGTDTLYLCFTAYIPGPGEPGIPGTPGAPGEPGGSGGPGGIGIPGILPGTGGQGGIGGPGIPELGIIPGIGGTGGAGGTGDVGQPGGSGGVGGIGGTGGTAQPGGNGGTGGAGGTGGDGNNGGTGGDGGTGGEGGPTSPGGSGGNSGPGGDGGTGGNPGPGGNGGTSGNPGPSNPPGPGSSPGGFPGGFPGGNPGPGGNAGPGGNGSVPCNDPDNLGQKICDETFKWTGCILAGIGCVATFTAAGSIVPGFGNVAGALFGALTCGLSIGTCVNSIMGVSTPTTIGGVDLLGCIGGADAVNCIGQYICNQVVKSCDPNDIIGPAGYGEGNFVAQFETLPYMIRFENDSTFATAAAQRVEIHMPVPPTLDPLSFRLKEFGFGANVFPGPENSAFIFQVIDLPDSLGYDIEYTAGVDVIGNEIFWVLQTVDPLTGLPPTDALAGFLAINDSLSNGEGFVSFTIVPSPSSSTGDTIFAEAEIVFDINDPIYTPRIFNTIDAGGPTSTVATLPLVSDSTTILIDFIGADDINGSGVEKYKLYVSEENGPWEYYSEFALAEQATFTGNDSTMYSFFSVAVDNVGNSEGMKDYPETTTIINPGTLTMGGLVLYDNVNSDALENVMVILSDSLGNPVDTSSTNSSGNYFFPSLIPGVYNINVVNANGWGGGNATDALIIDKFTVGSFTLTPLRELAGDVNLSNDVNATDGLLVKRRTIGSINSFTSGDWLFNEDTVDVNSNIVKDIIGVCYGDLNGSYIPSANQNKSESDNIFLKEEGELYTTNNSEFIVDIKVGHDFDFNAVTLFLQYNSSQLELLGGSSTLEGLIFNNIDSEIRIAWNNIETVYLKDGDILLSLKFRAKKTSSDCISTMSISSQSEFADHDALVINNIKLEYPEINILKEGEYSLSHNFPNPFNESTEIVYVLPEPGNVELTIYNSLGEYVETLVSQYQNAGSYKVNFNSGDLASGIYQYKINISGENKGFTKTRMMIIKK